MGGAGAAVEDDQRSRVQAETGRVPARWAGLVVQMRPEGAAHCE
jgi:hypothetical protein